MGNWESVHPQYSEELSNAHLNCLWEQRKVSCIHWLPSLINPSSGDVIDPGLSGPSPFQVCACERPVLT